MTRTTTRTVRALAFAGAAALGFLLLTALPPAPLAGANVLSVDDYIQLAGAQLEANGSFENEIGRRTDRYGSVVHLLSAYTSLRTADGEPFARGVDFLPALLGRGTLVGHEHLLGAGDPGEPDPRRPDRRGGVAGPAPATDSPRPRSGDR